MAATVASGGVNPSTGEQVVDQVSCRCALVVMATAGLYETSGDWLYTIGLPGKSGIGGGIVTVSPGKGGLGTFAPRLDAAGNSVKGQLAAHFFRASSAWTSLCPRPRGGLLLAACRIHLMQHPRYAPGLGCSETG
jgi:glutaminase